MNTTQKIWLVAALLFMVGCFAGIAKAQTPLTVTLTCEAPTTNTDGTPLTNLAGYNLYGSKRGVVKVKLATATVAQGCRFTRNPTNGIWEWYITAFNSESSESTPTETVVLDVDKALLEGKVPSAPGKITIEITR